MDLQAALATPVEAWELWDLAILCAVSLNVRRIQRIRVHSSETWGALGLGLTAIVSGVSLVPIIGAPYGALLAAAMGIVSVAWGVHAERKERHAERVLPTVPRLAGYVESVLLDPRGDHCLALVSLRVINNGSPSIAEAWAMWITVGGNKIMAKENISYAIRRFEGGDGSVTFGPNDLIDRTATVKPIETGGRVTGYYVAELPMSSETVMLNWESIHFTFRDSLGVKYQTVPRGRFIDTETLYYMPGGVGVIGVDEKRLTTEQRGFTVAKDLLTFVAAREFSRANPARDIEALNKKPDPHFSVRIFARTRSSTKKRLLEYDAATMATYSEAYAERVRTIYAALLGEDVPRDAFMDRAIRQGPRNPDEIRAIARYINALACGGN
jgi:hypothetical protein